MWWGGRGEGELGRERNTIYGLNEKLSVMYTICDKGVGAVRKSFRQALLAKHRGRSRDENMNAHWKHLCIAHVILGCYQNQSKKNLSSVYVQVLNINIISPCEGIAFRS